MKQLNHEQEIKLLAALPRLRKQNGRERERERVRHNNRRARASRARRAGKGERNRRDEYVHTRAEKVIVGDACRR